jgi:hypothetical protein
MTTSPVMTIWHAGSPPSSAVTGQIRFNSTIQSLEFFDGKIWRTNGVLNPETWQDWFQYYIYGSESIPIRTNDLKREYINQEMRGRFPGAYTVEWVNDDWQMIFDSPEEQTYWTLKYE